MFPIFLEALKTEAEKTRVASLYESQKDFLAHIAYQLLRNKSNAEDCVQDAFVYLVEHFDRFAPLEDEQIAAYLVTAVKSKAYISNKQVARQVFFLDAGIGDEDPEDEAAFETKIQYDELIDAIKELPDGYRELFLLYHLHGYTVKELCEQYGLKQSTIYKRLQAAKRVLYASLRESEGEDA